MSSTPSWSRYGSQRRLCARAGCNAPAVATLRFQPTERRAWLAELDDSAVRARKATCASVTPPRSCCPAGGSSTTSARSSPRAVPRRGGATPIEAVEVEAVVETIDAEPTDVEATGGEPEPEATAADANGAGPVLGGDDEAVEEALDTILDARTPLLRRAFRNARPRLDAATSCGPRSRLTIARRSGPPLCAWLAG